MHTCAKTLEKIFYGEPLANLTTICQFESEVDGTALNKVLTFNTIICSYKYAQLVDSVQLQPSLKG